MHPRLDNTDEQTTREQLLHIQAAFELALGLPEAERTAFAHRHFEGEPHLATHLLELLRADADPPPVLAKRAAPTGPEAPLPCAPGFELLDELGRGGMSVVYRARQHQPGREVALKVLRPAARLLGGDARLRREAEALARLSHPGIAQVYEVGMLAAPDDRAFVAMELVDGQPITRWASAGQPLRERVGLLAQVCEAVGHAHVRGVVHRDLKAANVLVTNDGASKVLDFGIARLLEDEAGGSTLTGEGQLMGTLGTMAPEQIAGPSHAVDQRADVYALGAMAYEALGGHPPFKLEGLDLPAQLRVLDQHDPASLASLRPELRGDLACIVAKAMERDPERRYASAGELAADLSRSLENKPILARAPTGRYLLGKLVRRHKAATSAGLAIAATVLFASGGIVYFALGEAGARREAEARGHDLDSVARFQARRLEVIDVAAMSQQVRDGLLAEVNDSVSHENIEAFITEADIASLLRAAMDEHIITPSEQAASEQFADRPLVRGRLLSGLGNAVLEQGDPARAIPLLEQAVSLLEEPPHDGRGAQAGTILGEALTALGTAHGATGNLEAAKATHQRALTLARSSQDGEQIRQALVASGSTYILTQDLGDAEACLDEAIGLLDGSANVGEILTPFRLHAIALAGAGRWDEALPRFERALEIARNGVPEHHPEFMKAVNNVGACLQRMNRAPEAEPYLHEAMRLRRTHLGMDHPQTWGAIANYGLILMNLGRPEEAEPLFREAVALFENAGRLTNDRALRPLTDLGTVLFYQGRYDESAEILERAIELRTLHIGEYHAKTLQAMHNLASVYEATSQPEDAERLYKEIVDRARRSPEGNQGELARALNSWAMLMVASGRAEEALPKAQEAVSIRTQRDGGDAHPTQYSRITLATALDGVGRGHEAIPIAESTYAYWIGQEHADNSALAAEALANIHARLADTNPDAGHEAEAKRWQDLADQAHAGS